MFFCLTFGVHIISGDFSRSLHRLRRGFENRKHMLHFYFIDLDIWRLLHNTALAALLSTFRLGHLQE